MSVWTPSTVAHLQPKRESQTPVHPLRLVHHILVYKWLEAKHPMLDDTPPKCQPPNNRQHKYIIHIDSKCMYNVCVRR